MKKFLVPLLLFCAFFVLTVHSLNAANENNPVIGEWVYEVSDAPVGYDKGSLVFSERDGQTQCVIKLEAGELATSNLKIGKDSISFTVFVEGNQVNVALTRDSNIMNGTVDSPDGPQAITAVKKE